MNCTPQPSYIVRRGDQVTTRNQKTIHTLSGDVVAAYLTQVTDNERD